MVPTLGDQTFEFLNPRLVYNSDGFPEGKFGPEDAPYDYGWEELTRETFAWEKKSPEDDDAARAAKALRKRKRDDGDIEDRRRSKCCLLYTSPSPRD
eukprot:1650489-Alexandrium_andersonii.AAC.1